MSEHWWRSSWRMFRKQCHKPTSCALPNSSTMDGLRVLNARAETQWTRSNHAHRRSLTGGLQLSGDEIWVTDRRSQHFDALLGQLGSWNLSHHSFWVGDAGNLNGLSHPQCAADELPGIVTWNLRTTRNLGPCNQKEKEELPSIFAQLDSVEKSFT